jgi:hypothetical protein
MSNSYTSEILYHLVGRRDPLDDDTNLATLRAILTSMEIRTNQVGEHSGGKTLCIDPERGCVDGEPIAQTVTCFCDIPFESLALHTSKYGRFGVGLDRSIVAEWGGRPVIYIPKISRSSSAINNTFCERVVTVWNGLQMFFPDMPISSTRVLGDDPKSPIEAVDMAESELAQMLAFVKTFDVDLRIVHTQNYYMEREWRKFGNLPLHMPLREIIAPRDCVESLRNEFPQLCQLAFRSV